AAGHIGKAARWLQIGAIAGAGATAAFAILPTVALPPATSHAYAAVSTMICYYISVHALIGSVVAGFAAFRCRAGFVSATRQLEPLVARIWWTYTALTGLLCLVLLYALPGTLP